MCLHWQRMYIPQVLKDIQFCFYSFVDYGFLAFVIWNTMRNERNEKWEDWKKQRNCNTSYVLWIVQHGQFYTRLILCMQYAMHIAFIIRQHL